MKFNFTCLLLAVTTTFFGQTQPALADSVFKRWGAAVIHIEASTSLFMEPSYFPLYEQIQKDSLLTPAEREAKSWAIIRNRVGAGGTAVFLQYQGIHFLITARHVLVDTHHPQLGYPYNQLFFPLNANTAKHLQFEAASLYIMPSDTGLHVRNYIFRPSN